MPNGDLASLLSAKRKSKSEFEWLRPSSEHPSKCQIALDLLEGMTYLHTFDPPVIHRDLKSHNVLLGADFEAKLSDFGISREVSLEKTMTSAVGTMAWIAPEVMQGGKYTEKADLYSFGVILSELDTCAKPFDGISNAMILLRVTAAKEKPELGPDCPEEIREFALRCLAFDPEMRPSAIQAHYELRTLLRGAHQSSSVSV